MQQSCRPPEELGRRPAPWPAAAHPCAVCRSGTTADLAVALRHYTLAALLTAQNAGQHELCCRTIEPMASRSPCPARFQVRPKRDPAYSDDNREMMGLYGCVCRGPCLAYLSTSMRRSMSLISATSLPGTRNSGAGRCDPGRFARCGRFANPAATRHADVRHLAHRHFEAFRVGQCQSHGHREIPLAAMSLPGAWSSRPGEHCQLDSVLRIGQSPSGEPLHFVRRSPARIHMLDACGPTF